MILYFPESLAKPLVMAKLNMAYLSSSKTEQNCCVPHCWCHHLGYSVPPAHHRNIWCRSTFGIRGPGLSKPTFSLRSALPMAPTTDNKLNFCLVLYCHNFCAWRSVMMIFNFSESLAKPLVMAELNMACLSSSNKRAKLLFSSLLVSPSRVLRAPAHHCIIWCRSTFGPTWPRPEQSRLFSEVCSPKGTDNRQQN